MIVAGRPAPLGSSYDGEGVNFALAAERAEVVELCLFDGHGTERRVELPGVTGGIRHGYIPGLAPGQLYGYRVHGRWAPAEGLRYNPHKLLIDPYARALAGDYTWSDAVFDFEDGPEGRLASETDSAAHVPRCVVTAPGRPPRAIGPRIPWVRTIVYEANVRGYTMRHPGLTDDERGRFRGMANGAILEYLKSLGVTSVELMPVFEFVDEAFLHRRGLRNFWGYNTIGFFAPAARYAGDDPRAEFVEMVDAIHEAGLEVLLDVAYNHTAEGGADGPTLAFRGIDNLMYYRTVPGAPGEYVNDTGCGNTLNADQPAVRDLVLDSLYYWVRDMGVDGFRFDLAPVLGRSAHGYTRDHPLLRAIEHDPLLGGVKLIAEPWDPGPGGYQLGNFPKRWAEWNDRYRDSARRYWRGDAGEAPEFARRLHGSADVFEPTGRGPTASVNFVAAHDGYTLTDVVSYESRHNEANGEDNRDGHEHNFSCNHGIEGPTADPAIRTLRRRQRLNLLTTLLFAQGTPMLLAGDEFGNSQGGNNNAYAQDNDTGWVDWSGLESDPSFTDAVRQLIRLRRSIPLFRQSAYVHGAAVDARGWQDIAWLHPSGRPMRDADWPNTMAFGMLLTANGGAAPEPTYAVALLLNPGTSPVIFTLPPSLAAEPWQLAFSTAETPGRALDRDSMELGAQSAALLTHTPQ